ncbi:hypothetical protein HKB36_25760 [Vibrio parahaemolyticus]|uniref:hypothetical protein n=1 Tax=Vibrio parahaemolyticus TaxID=670 RepID=UPI00146C167F|nr:hypothetical protein [Vibrio parahaemolyticus]MDF5453489.1 hypothetical protein [Vibrio parahaemolyticus]NMS06406.1 hypothetical protein [Vibrio parahaemolyticus]
MEMFITGSVKHIIDFIVSEEFRTFLLAYLLFVNTILFCRLTFNFFDRSFKRFDELKVTYKDLTESEYDKHNLTSQICSVCIGLIPAVVFKGTFLMDYLLPQTYFLALWVLLPKHIVIHIIRNEQGLEK